MIKSTLIKEDVTSNESSNNQNEVKPLTEDNQSDTYIVEKILARKKYQGSVLYKVKWKNYPLSSCSWEPVNNFEDIDIIKSFEESMQKKRKGKPGRKPKIFSMPEEKNKEKKEGDLEAKPKENENKSSESSASFFSSVKDLSLEGNIEEDIPLKILSSKQNIKDPKDLLCLVEWEKRKDGTKPTNSQVRNSLIKQKYPYILLDYYESQLTFSNKKRGRKISV